MPQNLRFKVNQPSVIGEVIDDEAVIVNLDSGVYYSLRDSGADIWTLIEQGAAVTQIVDQLVRRYNSPEKLTIEAEVRSIIAELRQEELIVPVAENTPSSGAPVTLAATPDNHETTFEKPILEKYTDMADLLLLDPIHEVDELGGWPHPAATNR